MIEKAQKLSKYKNSNKALYKVSFFNLFIFYNKKMLRKTSYLNKISIMFFIVILVQLISCQNITSITALSLEYDGTLGIGWGVFSIILAAITGIICCIFGMATIYPGVFVTLGFCLPISMFLFMAFVPLEQPGNLNLKDNPSINNFIVVKWVFFSFMLLGIIVIIIPFFLLWSNMLIPQRVDSRAQREYYEKYEKLVALEKFKVEKEKEKKKNLQMNENNAEILIPVRNNMENANVNLNNFDNQEENENNIFKNRDNSNPNANSNADKKKLMIGLRRRKQNIEENADDKIE